MYKKKSKLPYLIVSVAAVFLIAVIVLVPRFFGSKPDPEPETEVQTEQEISKHEVLIHKTNAGTIGFESKYLKSDDQATTVLLVPDKELVSMKVDPKEGKYLDKVSIYDAQSVNTSINNVITKLDGGVYNIDFTMPETNIVMTFQFSDAEVETPVLPAETETEEETEEKSPFGLTLHGVTADVITSYNGQFDDKDFLQQLGGALHVDSARSEYNKVTDVTFSTEEYMEAKESDKVYYYIYFNNDPKWKVLSTYHLKDNSYVFTELPKEEETEASELDHSGSGQAGYGYGSTGTHGTTGYTAPTVGTEPTTTTTIASLDIMAISKTFLDYTGGDNSKFYDSIFNYVVEEKGKTGEMVGTMKEYEIDPDAKKATIVITMNTGATINCTYSKEKNTYRFSGL